jgi:general nucleoside transport system permease protein
MDTTVTVLSLGVALMVPLLWASLGELITEQAGVLNVGVEGVMLIGSFGMALGLNKGSSLWVGLVVALGMGLACGLTLAILYVRLGTDQIVTGILFNVAAFGMTTTLAEKYVPASQVASLSNLKIPGLGDIPRLGDIFFDQNLLGYAAFVAAPIVFYVVRCTWFGLYARSASEHPKATESAGLNVWALRYAAVIIGCGLVGIGGAALTNVAGGFVAGGTNGRGFIALAIVVLGRWNPFAVVGGALLFGVCVSLAQEAQSIPGIDHIPASFLLMLPYVVTIVAVVFARGSRYPTAIGVPYRPSAKSRYLSAGSGRP